jgi:hypothetical protein
VVAAGQECKVKGHGVWKQFRPHFMDNIGLNYLFINMTL